MYWINFFPFVKLMYRFWNVLYRHCRLIWGNSLWYIWQLVERRQVAMRRVTNSSTPLHSGTNNNWVETVSKSSEKSRQSEGSRRWFPAAGDSGRWRVIQAWDSAQAAVTAGPEFCQDRRFFSHRLTGLSVPSTLHYCTWLTAARMKKKKLLTVGFYTDVPAEGLMFQSSRFTAWDLFFCHKALGCWGTLKKQLNPKLSKVQYDHQNNVTMGQKAE